MITLNGVEIKPTIFPDKTSQVWKVPNIEGVSFHIDFNFEHEGEIFHLMQLVHLIREENDTVFTNSIIGLRMKYFPYARQDKEVSNESTFALRTFIKLLKIMDFSYIETVDIHNIDPLLEEELNIKSYKVDGEIRDTIACCNTDTILFPDLGASKRYSDYNFGSKVNKIIADKVRNQQTGELLEYRLIGVKDSDNLGNVLIVDDLCDKGGTFIMAAKALREYQSVKNIDLFTSHGIYSASNGAEHLKLNGINRVFNHNGEV